MEMSASPISAMSARLRSGEVTAVELVNDCMLRASMLGRDYVAIAAIPRERALTEAREADARLARGERGALVGIPYGAKDLIAAKGAPTSWGVNSLIDRVIAEDATVVARLTAAGATLAMKLVTTSLAGAGEVSPVGDSAHGQPRNPWNPRHSPGGSSSGSAVAVATGIVPFALGTETGGSIVQPSAFCGVTGYRPTLGWVPRTGVMTLSRQLDKVGVLARSADDVLTVLTAIKGADPRDPDSVDLPSGSRQRLVLGGVSDTEFEHACPAMTSRIRAGLDEIGSVLGPLRPAGVSPDYDYGWAIETLIRVDAAVFLEDLIDDRSTVLSGGQLEWLRAAGDVSSLDYARALHIRDAARAEFRRIFAEVDYLVTCAYPTHPPLLDAPPRARSSETVSERTMSAANLACVPGVAIPIGLDDDGFPVSLHLVGPPDSDHQLLAVASRFQSETGHHTLAPAVAGPG